MGNTPNGITTKVSADLEDRIMAVLPKPIRDYLNYEAPANMCTGEIFKALRAGSPVDQVLYALRSHQRRQTREFYCAAHPQASRF